LSLFIEAFVEVSGEEGRRMRREFAVSDFLCIFQVAVLTSKGRGSIWKCEELALIGEEYKISVEAF
jgi:hypothetical protein